MFIAVDNYIINLDNVKNFVVNEKSNCLQIVYNTGVVQRIDPTTNCSLQDLVNKLSNELFIVKVR